MTSFTVEGIENEIAESIRTKKLLIAEKNVINKIHALSSKCIDSLNSGGKIIFCGNGGSFADAQHLSAEFTSRFLFNRAPLASVVLGANSSAMSAIGNDYGFEQVFTREIQAIGHSKDILIAISTSGNSINVINALRAAQDIGIESFVLTGESGGKMQSIAKCINIPSNNTARIQECHILVGHIICGIVEAAMFKK